MQLAAEGFLVAFVVLLSGSFAASLLGARISTRLYAAILLAAAALGIGSSLSAWHLPVSWTVPGPVYLGVAPVSFLADRLSCVFIFLLSIVTVAVSLFAPGYMEHLKDRVSPGVFWAALLTFVLSMGGVVLAQNALTFIVLWEVMSLSSAVLVGLELRSLKAGRAALIYLGATRVATALLAVGFMLFYLRSGDWSFSSWHTSAPEALLPALLILLGLAIKAGLWPFHIWLPYAHPAAPSPVSALMSGVMIKIAMYAVIRLFVLGDGPSAVLGLVLATLGVVSAVWGVVFALVQHDLKRLLAYSSVENIGLVAVAVGLSMYAASRGWEELESLALVAGLFHTVNHGMFKSLLFLGAGAIDCSVHTRELSQLGGLVRSMPYTMAAFLTGSAAISALPPLNGFASKWLVYQSLFQLSSISRNELELAASLACIGVLAVVGGLSLACFTMATAVAFLGRPRSRPAKHAREVPASLLGAQWLLAGACVAFGVGSPWVSGLIESAVRPLPAPAAADTLPVTAVALAMAALAALIYWSCLRRKGRDRTYQTWECGFGPLASKMQISAESFAQPIANLFHPVLLYRLSAEISGRDRRHFPERVKATASMQSLLESRLYGPLIGSIRWLSDHLARLQAGSIHFYLLYVLVTLVILLILGSRT